jgi:hypothetical protein
VYTWRHVQSIFVKACPAALSGFPPSGANSGQTNVERGQEQRAEVKVGVLPSNEPLLLGRLSDLTLWKWGTFTRRLGYPFDEERSQVR